MRIISHRGYWKTPAEKNTLEAFRRSFALGFGTETDLRDRDGQLVVSHDPASWEALPANAFFSLAAATPEAPLALNIKADGLAPLLLPLMREAGRDRCFAFDMTVPEMVRYIALGLPVYTRISDVEQTPVLIEQCAGVWLDSFADDVWIDNVFLADLVSAHRPVCIVSPELHARSHDRLWSLLRAGAHTLGFSYITLCTDLPEEAKDFFQ